MPNAQTWKIATLIFGTVVVIAVIIFIVTQNSDDDYDYSPDAPVPDGGVYAYTREKYPGNIQLRADLWRPKHFTQSSSGPCLKTACRASDGSCPPSHIEIGCSGKLPRVCSDDNRKAGCVPCPPGAIAVENACVIRR